ncbi:MAG: HAD hydrolase-like protein [bacterium]
MNKKVVIFDVDGVLFDSVELMHQDTKVRYPTLSDKEIRDLHTGNIFEEISKITHLMKEETEEERKERTETYTKNKANAPMYEGIKELLHHLADICTLVVNSSAILPNCIPLFDREGITELFSFIATKEVHTSKVEKFKIIAEKFNQKIENMIFITDTIGDIKEAREVGLPTIAVTWGVHPREYFEEGIYENLIAIVDTTTHLEEYIKNHF